MLATNLPLRQTVELAPSPKRSLSFSEQKFGPRTHFKPIQCSQSSLLSPSIFSDDCYNNMIYQWRKSVSAPIVRVLQLATITKVNSTTGTAHTHKTIKPEPLHSQLSNCTKFAKQQLLLILRSMLDGHQAIYKKLKATSVSLDKSFITAQGDIKVWINQKLERNDISGEILNQEEDIVKKIFQTVCFLDSNNQNTLNDLTDYVNAAIKRNGRWTFSYLRALIKSYSDCLKIKIPKNLKKYQKQPSSYIQYSLIQNPMNQPSPPKQLSLKKTKQQSFLMADHYLQSSLQCSQNSRRNSQATPPSQYNSISLNSYDSSKTTTSQSIKQNAQHSLKFNTLSKRGKHTSSFSRLIKNNCNNANRANLLSSTQIPSLHLQHQHQNNYNQILLNNIGITPLPQVQDEYCLSPCAKRTLDKFTISSQFNMKIQTNGLEGKPSKNSIISTNKTSTTGCQFCFNRKCKGSHMDLTIDEKQHKNNSDIYRAVSKDRLTQKVISKTAGEKKAMTSCTNWENVGTNTIKFDHLLKCNPPTNVLQTKEEEHQDSIRSFSKLELDKQVLSFKSITDLSSKQLILSSSQQSQRESPKLPLTTPITLAKQLKSQQQIEQSQKPQQHLTQRHESLPSDHSTKLSILVQEKLLQLLHLNRKLVISTYMQPESQAHKKPETFTTQSSQQKLKALEDTLTSLITAKRKQSQIIEENSWSKTLETLLNLDRLELKQSMSDEEASALLKELKLEKVGKLGGDGQTSLSHE